MPVKSTPKWNWRNPRIGGPLDFATIALLVTLVPSAWGEQASGALPARSVKPSSPDVIVGGSLTDGGRTSRQLDLGAWLKLDLPAQPTDVAQRVAAANDAFHAALWGDLIAQPTPQNVPQTIPTTFQEMLLEVDVNQQKLDETVLVLRQNDGTLWVAQDDLQRWRLRRPATTPHWHGDKAYFPLGGIPGLRFTLDQAKLTLQISAPPEAFGSSVLITPVPHSAPPITPGWGGFLNYNLFAAHSDQSTQRSGLFEAGVFNPFGVVTNSFVVNSGSIGPESVRLDTTWTTDFPTQLTTLRLGDATNRPGTWGRSLRFGGIQYGTNFATQPGFITFPTLATSGEAVLPSTVDVFVNNALIAQRQVPPGPFSITNLPIVSGTGNVQMVVRDILGRQQVVNQPFYANASLLKAGLQDFSLEAGVARNDFGLHSNNYGTWLATGTYRRGFSDQLTGEAHGELTHNLEAAGVTANYLLADIATVRGSTAASHSSSGAGGLAALGLERISKSWSASLQAQWTNARFRQVGLLEGQLPPRLQLSASAGYQFGALGSVSAGYVKQDLRDQAPVQLLSASYSVSLGRFGNVGLNTIKTIGQQGAVTVSATWSIPLADLTSASVTLDRTRDGAEQSGTRETFNLQRSLPPGEGWGYRVVARDRGDLEAGVSAQNNVGTYTVEAARFQGATAERVNISGGIGWVSGQPFFSRTISDSFGVVKVADYPNVHVLQDNQIVGRTNGNGYAVLPRMRPYDKNPVSIQQTDLPLDAQIGSLKLDAVPYYRSGVLLDFPVKRVRGATLRIKLDDGSDMPSGALVAVEGGADNFPVGLDGEVYLTGLTERNRLHASWRNQSCEIDVPYPPTRDPLPDLGTFACKGVRP